MDNKENKELSADSEEILKELEKELLEHQPQDVVQFCATYFHYKLKEQRAQLISLAQSYSESYNNNNENENENDEASQEDEEEEMEDALENMSESAATSEKQDASSNTGSVSEDEKEEEQDTVGSLSKSKNMDVNDHIETESEDETMDLPPPPPVNYNRGRRTSVSAESMAPTTDKNYVKVIIPKTQEQRKRIQVSISNNFLFKNLDEEQYTDVVNAMSEKRAVNGDIVIKQGGVGDFFYVVETGTLDIYISKNGNPPIKVGDYGAGASFGELALMYNAPRAATITATSDCILWALDRITFRKILMENTSRKRKMYEIFLEEVPLLQSLEPYERHKIADALESVTYNDGEIVIKQGDVGENFYLIESGEAAVLQEDDEGIVREISTLHKGEYFGELALLTDKPRAATIKAKGKIKCATLGKKAFTRLLGPVVDIIKRNTANYNIISQNHQIVF
ncbi:camp-dependent protein kinase regulatory subunit [Piromyces finnis]|uniref:cAMP-dependent protein kinase regulatory subunit n=1 Tax=Piromyces finnis TaxID=1754191 RepID=A0A1Y1V3M3_9FUNG|nr:camp-dependent protein kinase regulatory subunit [Piromyces finnis]|eukprot:ORX45623.1 camp-dependent protein kinase regulatory subunit [Piromyces finnis]